MTMSPYDNLPIGKNKQNTGEVRYEEVSFEPPEASGSPDTQAKAGEPYQEQADQLHYVDVPVENVPPERTEFQPQTIIAADGEGNTIAGTDANTADEAAAIGVATTASDHKAEAGESVTATAAATEMSSNVATDEAAASGEDSGTANARYAADIVLPETPENIDTRDSASSWEKAAADEEKAASASSRRTAGPSSSHREPRDFSKVTPMESAPQYSRLQLKNMWSTEEYLLPFEETLLVPDTMPDMASVLFAEGSVHLSQPSKYSYERDDFISGEVVLYTVYKPATTTAAPIDVVKSSVSFKTDKCWENAEGDSFRVALSVKSISAEMLNERKFTAKGTISIRFTQIAKKDLMVFKGTGDEDLIKRESTVRATDLIFEASEATEISQEINLHEDQPAPLKILKESFNVIENHKQITSGKLVVNGTIISNILYIGQEDDDRKLCSLNNKTDFTQFIVIDDDIDAGLIQASFIGDSLKASIENQNQFMIQGQVITNICGYENKDISMVSDAYHKKRDIKFDTSDQQLSFISGTVSGEISAREVVNINETERKPETLLCGSAQISQLTGSAEKGRIVIEGSVTAKLLALDEDENPFVIDSVVPLRGSLEMAEAAEGLDVNVTAAIKEFWFDSINSRQMEINAGVSLEVWTRSHETFRTIENLCFVENKEPHKHIPMAIYVVGCDDTLWDIAKRYKSDSEVLAQLNQLDADKPLSEGTKLFIIK